MGSFSLSVYSDLNVLGLFVITRQATEGPRRWPWIRPPPDIGWRVELGPSPGSYRYARRKRGTDRDRHYPFWYGDHSLLTSMV